MKFTELFRTLVSLCVTLSLATKPNFIVILGDDVGYGDFQSYGHPTQERGPIDELASQGLRFTQWYSADSVCTPSRAALLTGRYPVRSGIVGPERVFWVFDQGGLPKQEITLPEALKEHGYTTGMVGKWHLGINKHEVNDGNHLPNHHGFDYVGTNLPFTHHFRCDPKKFPLDKMHQCVLYENSTFIEQPYDPTTLTERLVKDSVNFVNAHSYPYFLYVGMPQTHSSMICSENFCNKSRRGLYGDNINELSWAIGEIVNAVKSQNSDTLIIFLSDHGPQFELCQHGGSAGVFKGGKASSWEGGIRVPAIAWWPGKIQPNTVNYDVVSSMDIFPTLLELASGRKSTQKQVLDGVSIANILLSTKNDSAKSLIHDILFNYCSDKIMAVRFRQYKIHFYTQSMKHDITFQSCYNGDPIEDMLSFLDCEDSTHHEPPLMFNINLDPSESFPLDSERYKDVLDVVYKLMETHKKGVVKVPRQIGRNTKKLYPCCSPPHCLCGSLSERINHFSKTEL